MITNRKQNIEKIKNKHLPWSNFEYEDGPYYAENANTFLKDNKEGMYLFFYAEDAIRYALTSMRSFCSFYKPNIAEFDISIDILTEYLGLGIYGNSINYYIALEFAIPRGILHKKYQYEENEVLKCSCITDRLYTVPYDKCFAEVDIPTDISRQSYTRFNTDELPIIMKMLNVEVVPPNENYHNRYEAYGFSKFADNFSGENATKILKRLDNLKR
jgi:hypothetical protein